MSISTWGVRAHNYRGSETSEVLKSPFIANVASLQKIDKIPIWSPFQVDESGAGTGALEVADGTNLANLNTSGIFGLTCANGAVFNALWDLPDDLDPTAELAFAIKWSNSEAASASKTVGYTLQYTPLLLDTTALAASSTTTGVSDGAAVAVKAANVMQLSGETTISAATVAAWGVKPGVDQLHLEFTVALTTASDATVYGIYVKYYRRQM